MFNNQRSTLTRSQSLLTTKEEHIHSNRLLLWVLARLLIIDWFFSRKQWNRFAQVCHQQQKIRLLRGNAVKRVSVSRLRRHQSVSMRVRQSDFSITDMNPDVALGLDLSNIYTSPRCHGKPPGRAASLALRENWTINCMNLSQRFSQKRNQWISRLWTDRGPSQSGHRCQPPGRTLPEESIFCAAEGHTGCTGSGGTWQSAAPRPRDGYP